MPISKDRLRFAGWIFAHGDLATLQSQKAGSNQHQTRIRVARLSVAKPTLEYPILNTKPRLTGEPIMRILCEKTDRLVGYLYQWDNGDVQPAWFDGAMADVRYEPIEQDTSHCSRDRQKSGRKSHDNLHPENV